MGIFKTAASLLIGGGLGLAYYQLCIWLGADSDDDDNLNETGVS